MKKLLIATAVSAVLLPSIAAASALSTPTATPYVYPTMTQETPFRIPTATPYVHPEIPQKVAYKIPTATPYVHPTVKQETPVRTPTATPYVHPEIPQKVAYKIPTATPYVHPTMTQETPFRIPTATPYVHPEIPQKVAYKLPTATPYVHPTVKQETPVRIPTATPYVYPETIPKQIALAAPVADELIPPHDPKAVQEVPMEINRPYKGVGTVANAGKGQFTRPTTNADLISSNTNDVKQVAAMTTANADLIAFEQNDIAANTRHEKSTEQRVIQNSQTFVLYDKRISSNRDAVDKNTADIQQNTNDIKDLRSDFKEMGKRVDGTAAMGMATSSLFQPYGIGKANVTVGLGNYNGANAVAFGSGIRIDEHVALRANVAYVDSTNDTGFGVGASYEW